MCGIVIARGRLALLSTTSFVCMIYGFPPGVIGRLWSVFVTLYAYPSYRLV